MRLKPAPKPLRTRTHPRGGDPDYDPPTNRDWDRLREADLLLERSCAIIEAGFLSSAISTHCTENPADRGYYPYPSIFDTPDLENLRTKCKGRDFQFHQCTYGLNYMKPTQVLTNAANASSLVARCNHPNGHPTMEGVDERGRFRTTSQSAYPPDLCRAFANIFLEQRLHESRKGVASNLTAFDSFVTNRTKVQRTMSGPAPGGTGMGMVAFGRPCGRISPARATANARHPKNSKS